MISNYVMKTTLFLTAWEILGASELLSGDCQLKVTRTASKEPSSAALHIDGDGLAGLK